MGVAAAADGIVTAALLVIGDEILSGRTKDRNIGFIAEHLTGIGIQLREVRVVPDVEAEIVAAVDTLRHRFHYLFTTGGIGPTHDDITADAIAKAFGVEIDIDERAVAVMRPHYETMQLPLTPARLRMARIPTGADLIDNAISKAPGFKLGNVVVMAGVPSIMQAMLIAVTPSLRTGARMQSATLTVWRPESDIADLFRAVQGEFPEVAMGSYPFSEDGKYGAHLVLRSIAVETLAAAEGRLRAELVGRGWI